MKKATMGIGENSDFCELSDLSELSELGGLAT
jgi:hypothetical protein